MRGRSWCIPILAFLLISCSSNASQSTNSLSNPNLPPPWTPTPSSPTGLSSTEEHATETLRAASSMATATPSPSRIPSSEAERRASPPPFTGGEQWLVTIPGVDYPYLARAKDGGILVLGRRTNPQASAQNILFKLDPRGEILWERVISPANYFGILGSEDGGVILVEIQQLFKLDQNGEMEWKEYLSYDQDESPFFASFYDFQSSQLSANGQAVLEDSFSITYLDQSGRFIRQQAILSEARDGRTSIWLTSQAKWTAGLEDRYSFWVLRESPTQPAWLRRFNFQELGITLNAPETQILGTRDGGVLFAATVRNLIRPGFAIWVVRMDRSGNILWQTAIDGVDEFNLKVHETMDGGFIIASSSGYWGRDIFGNFLRVLRVDSSGKLQWDRFIGDGKWRVAPKAILNNPNGGVLIAAEVDAPGDVLPSEAGDLVLIKLGDDGLIPGCNWVQHSPHALPLERTPSSSLTSIGQTPLRIAVIKGHEILPESIPPENLQIEDGFDNFSTHCVFPAYPDLAPAVFDADSEFARQIDADVEELHPLAIGDGTLIGASMTGDWVSSERVIDYLEGRWHFLVFSIGGPTGETHGVVRRAASNGGCPGSPTIAFSPPIADQSSIAFAAEWNAQPRAVSALSPSLQVYKEILHEHLKEDGIGDPKTSIDSLVRADLDGDGLEEVIISASWFDGGHSKRGVKAGDYSVVLLRSVVQGEVRTQSLISDIYQAAYGATIPVRYQIAGMLDLNGDGLMEIIVRSDSEVARGYQVFDLRSSLETPVLRVSCAAP